MGDQHRVYKQLVGEFSGEAPCGLPPIRRTPWVSKGLKEGSEEGHASAFALIPWVDREGKCSYHSGIATYTDIYREMHIYQEAE
jgi:hypothetical protein